MFAEFVKPLEQAFPQRLMLPVGFARLEGIDGILYVRCKEVHAQVAAVQPRFPQQRVPRKTRMQLSNLLDRGANALATAVVRIQLVRPEVFVDVPDASAVSVCNSARQGWAEAGQADRRQPSLRHQLVALGDHGSEALDDPGAHLAVNVETDAENPRGSRLQY